MRVTPAPVERVECDLTATTPTPECNSCDGDGAEPESFGERGSAFCPANACGVAGSSPAATQQQESLEQDGLDAPAVEKDPCTCAALPPAAVDPVSLMLAQAEADRCQQQSAVREDSLSFGPIATPKDVRPPPTVVPDVNEEGLYALGNPVVELKACGKGLGLRPADALTVDEAAAAGPVVNLPSYMDVGYQTEAPSCAPLTTVTDNNWTKCSCRECSRNQSSCRCKFCSSH